VASAYLLLINDVLKDHILGCSPAEKQRLLEKLEFLANGIWDGGVRVKKLKGISGKAVFEARLSRGQRILFTLGRHQDRIAIYLWGIAAHDDVNRLGRSIVPRNAPFLLFEPQSTEEWPELLVDELPEYLFTQESVEEKAAEDHGPQRWLVLSEAEWRRLLAEAEPGSLDIHLFLTSEQQAVLDGDLPLLLSGTAGSGKTTILVYSLLRPGYLDKRRLFLTYNPLLKRFSKRLYCGLIKNTELELAAEESREADRAGGADGCGRGKDANGSAGAGGGERSHPDFLLFGELVEAILESGSHCGKEGNERRTAGQGTGLETFEGIFRNHALYRRYDTELVWEEIRSIIKGAKPPLSLREYSSLAQACLRGDAGRREIGRLQDCLLGLKPFEFFNKIEALRERKTGFESFDQFVQSLADPKHAARDGFSYMLAGIGRILERRTGSLASPLLSLAEYRSLGRKRAPNFLYDREEIYSIAEYYQQRLEAEGLEDEIDLCRQAIHILDANPAVTERFSYDLVVCDEVQDFVDIQLSLVLRLVRSLSALAFAGDPRQIINPSGFRWEELRQKFFERGLKVPQVQYLRLNFRCVGSVVRLANALLSLKQRLVGLGGSELREDWKFQGKPPFLVTHLAEAQMARYARPQGAGRIVLVRSDREQARAKRLLDTELVFTIYEAKGLEFDGVLLWKYAQDDRAVDIWRRIRRGQPFDQTHAPHIRHEINLLYVAVTRARNTLVVYDGAKAADVWQVEELRPLIHQGSDEQLLSGMWKRISTPREWADQGRYFFERGFFDAAAESFRNAGDRDRKEIAEAFAAKKKEIWSQAAELFARQNVLNEAAECFEKGGSFREAARLWRRFGEQERSLRCTIRALEQEGKYGQAAREWEQLGEMEAAIRNWDRAGNYGRLGDIHYQRGDYLQAARMYEKKRSWSAAAASYRRIGETARAAELYFKDKDYNSAAGLYRKLKDQERLLKCYELMGDHYAAGRIREKRKELPEAVLQYRLFAEAGTENRNSLLKEAQRFERGRGVLKAALRYSALGLADKSAPLFLSRKRFDLARRDFLEQGQRLEAAQCLASMGENLEAVRELEELEFPDKWERILELLDKHLKPRWFMDPHRAEALTREADSLLKQGKTQTALVRFRALGDEEGIYAAFRKMKSDEEALRYYLDKGMVNWAEDYVDDRGEDISVSDGLLTYLCEKTEAEGDWYLSSEGKCRLALDLFVRRMKEAPEKTRPLLTRVLGSIDHYMLFDEDLSEEIFQLYLESRHPNALADLAGAYLYLRDRLPETVGRFFEKLRELAREEGDRELLACALQLLDPEGCSTILEELPAGPDNYRLFARQQELYRKAVEFLLSGQNLSERALRDAAWICRINDDWEGAARVEELRGDLKQAGKHYLQAVNYEEALRCYRQAGDVPGEARVHERMEDYQGALEIWQGLRRKRDVERVRKKLERSRSERGQLDLF
jgi:tetratricopeptide (TPR) repeat protein